MELNYNLCVKKAQDPILDDTTGKYLVSAVVHGNDLFYKDQGMNWGAGFKNEWLLDTGSEKIFRTGVSLPDVNIEDITVTSVLDTLEVNDVSISEDNNELLLSVEASERTKIKTGDQIFALSVKSDVGVYADEEPVDTNYYKDSEDED